MSSHYHIELAPAAKRQMKKLIKSVQKTVISELENLQKNPRPSGVKKLAGMDNLYRVAVDEHRIIYTIDDKKRVVLILKIGDRKEVYRLL